MKKIYLITQQKLINERICSQLKELFGEEIKITGLWEGEYEKLDYTDGLIVISSSWVFNSVKEKIIPGANYIVAERVLNYKHLDELSLIEDGNDVIVFNYYRDICDSIIGQLKNVGFTGINFIPATSVDVARDGYKYALISGAIPALPQIAETVIDIGERMLDIPSLVEIMKRLDLLVDKENTIHFQSINKILELLEKYKSELNRNKEITSLYQTIVNNSRTGIVYINSDGRILISNKSMKKLIGIKAEGLEGKNITLAFSEIKNWKPVDPEKEYLVIAGKEIVLSKFPVKRDNICIGIVLVLEDPLKIEHDEYDLRRRNRSSKHNAVYSFEDIITENEIMRKNIDFAKKIASGMDTILIQGESGTGKELFAQAIHNYSSRNREPFVPVNFSGLSESLLESELFGYQEGAFTGALKGGKKGLFEKAHGGTIFLDEIGDAPLGFQTKLLRVLQERQVKRVGGNEIIPVDVRVIAASNLSLIEAVKKGRFRKDLYYRINVLPINLPNLKNRSEDIPLLLKHYFMKRYNVDEFYPDEYFTLESLSLIHRYDWPGNIRQLINTVKHLSYIKIDNVPIKISDLPLDLHEHPGLNSVCGSDPEDELINDETKWILKVLHRSRGGGRLFLYRQAEAEGIELSEARIRNLLSKLSKHGYIESNVGTRGSVLTEKGRCVVCSIELAE